MMKKLLLTTILMTSMIACYKDDAILNESPQDPLTKSQAYRSGNEYVKMKRHKITPNRALTIAEEAKALFADENERLLRTRSIGLALAPVAITSQAKGRSAGGVDTLLYIVNYSNNNDFVFVSNDDRDGEVLMYAGGGNFAMQDTTGNPGLKLHVEMVLAYQAHKLNEIKSAEARGEEYIGGMTTMEVDDDLPTMLMAPNDVATFGISGQPGGMPGHTCNVTGQPGMPGVAGTPARKDICAPSTYESKNWFGNADAIELAQKKYRNQKCFGIPVLPPSINFMTTSGGPGHLGTPGEAPLCESKPYCVPPLWSYKEYYGFYGCHMDMHLKTVRDIVGFQVQPLLTTYWTQEAPLNHGANAAGCAPIAMAQLMVYHKLPKAYGSQAYGGTHRTEIDELRKLRTNDDITNSYYCYAAQKFLQEIRTRLDVTYNSNGSTSTNANFRMKKVRKAFESFGYTIGYNNGAGHHGVWDYYRDYNFETVRASIYNKKPVYIRGSSKGGGNGHQWLLDGYKELVIRKYYADYYFDEYGKFNAENRYYKQEIQVQYVHANMGWATNNFHWVERGVYEFGAGNTYDKYLCFLAGITPKTI